MRTLSAVILAAGNGTRFLPLTTYTPKPLIKIAGKPAIEYNMDAMAPYVKEFIIVVGYLKEKFIEHFGSSYKGVPVRFIEQDIQKGTSDAFAATKDQIHTDQFFLIYGDDIYAPKFYKALSERGDSIIGQTEENWQPFGVFQLKEGNLLDKLVEKPSSYIGNLVNPGVYHLKTEVFNYLDKVPKSSRGEYELTDLVTAYAKDHPVEIVEMKDGWTPLSYPWHILDATKKFLSSIETKINGTVEQGATIHGKVTLGKGSIIKAGAYLEGNYYIGENTVIGPNCWLNKFASIGDDCVIGNGVTLVASVVGDKFKSKYVSVINDTIIGNNVNLAGGTIIANWRHDDKNHKMMINEKLVDTGRRKMGAIIGDNVRTGINTSIYPGRKLYSDTTTLPGEIVTKDKR